MTTVWPPGKGPLSGKCSCGGTVHVRWKGIYSEYFCDKCGIVTDHPGRREQLPRQEVKKVVDMVFSEIKQPTVDYRAFLILVDQVCFQSLGGRFPVIKVEEFERWGYVIHGTRIKRKSR
jgi:hypothetical protein